jgi:hypothetical protein
MSERRDAMLNTRNFGLKAVFQAVLVLGTAVAGIAFVPAASAAVHVGFDVNLVLPPGVHVSATNFAPYYVGRVYYEPAAVWRPVYSFPVATAYGVVYRPYVYDGGRPVCRGYIPGPTHGYSSIVVDGRGHFDPRWYHGPYHRGGRDYATYHHGGQDRHERGSHHGGDDHHGDHR